MCPMSGPRSVSVGDERVRFWVVESDPLVNSSALLARGQRDGGVLEEPARHPRVDDYPEDELARLWEERPR